MPVSKAAADTPRSSTPPPAQHSTFEEAVVAVMAELQGALADLVARLPGPIHRAVDLERALDLDKTLAWQVFRIVQSRHALAQVANIPARASIERLAAAGRRRRIPASVVDRVNAAFDRFEAFAVSHAGDRKGLISMVSGVAPDAIEQVDLKVRKALFRGNAHVWGVQAQTIIRTAIYHVRSAEPRHVEDGVGILGQIGLQRLRPGAPLAVGSWVRSDNTPVPFDEPSPGSASGAPSSPEGIPTTELLPAFCSTPLPQMVGRRSVGGAVETELLFPASGRADAVTLYTSAFMPETAIGVQSRYGMTVTFKMPAETAVCELLVPAGLTDPGTARVAIFGRREHPDDVLERRTIDLFPQRETVAYLGALESVPSLPDQPQHAEAVRHVLRERGWLGAKFDVYRCRVQFPVLHTMLALTVDPKRQSAGAPA